NFSKSIPKDNSNNIPSFDLTLVINNNQRSNSNRESIYLPKDCEILTLDNITTISSIHTLRPFEDEHNAHQAKSIHVKKDVNATLELFKNAANNTAYYKNVTALYNLDDIYLNKRF
ncbi:4213_t:CDS:2, partial [Cetraspora pellucida]